MTGKLATSHATDGVNKVAAVKVLKPVLIRVMGVGATVKVHCRRILLALLVVGVLGTISTCAATSSKGDLHGNPLH